MYKYILFVVFAFVCACSSNSSTKPNGEESTNPSTNVPSNTNSDPTVDNGSDAGYDDGTNQPGTTDAGPTNQAECIAACESTYPKAAANSAKLSKDCMLVGSACESVCNNLPPSDKSYTPSVDAGTCDTDAAKSFPIGTPSQACSDCLASTPACCQLWITIFSSKEGQDLNACAQVCWTKFTK